MDLFYFKNYKLYLKSTLSTKGNNRGSRLKLAKYLSCQSGFISQVLNGHTHFSLEHSIKVSEYLNHDKAEKHYFMLLVQKSKAGSMELKKYYKEQILLILKKREDIKFRIEVQTSLSDEHHSQYYSQWYYAAIHILVSIAQYQTIPAISERLGLNKKIVIKSLDFLTKIGLVEKNAENFKIGQQRIHLDNQSPQIFKHHTNWRLEAIKSLESENTDNLHYSSIVTMSKKDSQKIKEQMLKCLKEIENILLPSKEEEIFSVNMDFFQF